MQQTTLDDLAPLPDPTALPRVFGRADAARLGVTDNMIAHRLRTGRWRLILPRTILTTDTVTWLDRQHAALSFAGRGSLLTARVP